ncbi:MAG: phenylalanine--tRNA ligase subunit beta [Thermoplasmata archaeon]|nr:MAG: phenylalanine--tRNA ligase subunit beta [Thermoplasmata archaeon]
MPVINFSYTDFINLLGKDMDKNEFLERFPLIGCEIERVKGDDISIEIFPDRSDMNSVEGIARAARAFFGIEKGLKTYKIEKSDVTTYIDEGVKEVRPVIVTALVKNVEMSDELISSLMQLQEKLHMGIGRNRKKIAIGVHDFDRVKPPFKYKAVNPESVRFVPLNFEEEMSLSEILKKHPKGIEYAHLLDGKEKYPLLVDKDENVLSFPPIINGILTQVTPYTENIFIDITGMDEQTAKLALNIVCTALAERGGEIYTTKVIDSGEEKLYPDFTPEEMFIDRNYAESVIGLKFSDTEIEESLLRMGYDVEISQDKIKVKIPPWRGDILHEIDIVEDIAIGYGFDRLTPQNPKHLTYGKPLEKNKLVDKMRTILIGLGFYEVETLTLSNERDEFEKLGMEESKVIKIENPISEEYTCLRSSLLPSLLKICRVNRHRSLPQRIFEVGYVVDENRKNILHLSFVEIDERTNFSRCKSLFEAISRDSGINMTIEKFDHPAFIQGRCAGIVYNGSRIGYFGEIHPRTLVEFELEHPAIAMEINLEKIG